MPREYEMFTFLRLFIVLALAWAVVGSFLFSALMKYLGWDSMNVEWQMALFGGLSLAGAVFLSVSIFIILQTFMRRKS